MAKPGNQHSGLVVLRSSGCTLESPGKLLKLLWPYLSEILIQLSGVELGDGVFFESSPFDSHVQPSLGTSGLTSPAGKVGEEVAT